MLTSHQLHEVNHDKSHVSVQNSSVPVPSTNRYITVKTLAYAFGHNTSTAAQRHEQSLKAQYQRFLELPRFTTEWLNVMQEEEEEEKRKKKKKKRKKEVS